MHMLRELMASDADSLFEIDSAATPHPWTLRQFNESLTGNDFGWGVEIDGQLVGFVVFQCVLDEATLMNVAVKPAFQRKGVARSLLQDALHNLQQRDITRCLLEVRASNQAAIALYQRLGFLIDGCRRNYYPVGDGACEDAVLMSRSLLSPQQHSFKSESR